MSNKTLLKLTFVLIPLGIIYLFVATEAQIGIPDQANIFSSAELANVKSIVITEKKKTVTLGGENGKWAIAEKANYSADPGKIRSLLLKLENLNIDQIVTEDSKNFPALGLAEDSPELGKISITSNGKSTNLIFGKMREASNEESEAGRYVRKDGDTKAYLVFGTPTLDTTFSSWANTEISNIPTSTITEVRQFKIEKQGETFTEKEIFKVNYSANTTEGAPSYELPGIEPGKTIDVQNISQVVSGLENLQLDNVFSAEDLAKKKKQIQFTERTDYFLNSGLTYSVSTGKGKKNHYLKLNVLFDAERAKALSELAAKDLEKTKEKAEESDAKPASSESATPEAAVEATKAPVKPIVVMSSESEAQKLNEEYSKWVYQVPEYLAGKFRKSKEDLIAKPETPPTPPAE
jgi:ribosomal protein L12E/L44/L45/RPP1/RPP2